MSSFFKGSRKDEHKRELDALRSERDAALRRAQQAEGDCEMLNKTVQTLRVELESKRLRLADAEGALRAKNTLRAEKGLNCATDATPAKSRRNLFSREFTSKFVDEAGAFVDASGRPSSVRSRSQNAVTAGLLGLLPTFSSLHSYERHQLAKAFRVEVFRQGEFIVRQDEIGDRFYILISGLAEVIIAASVGSRGSGGGLREAEEGSGGAAAAMAGETIADGVRAATLEPGDHFGESALMRGLHRTASIVVTSVEAEVTSIGRDDFQGLLGRFERLAVSNMKTYETYASSNKESVEGIRARISGARTQDEYLQALRVYSAHVIPLVAEAPTAAPAAAGATEQHRSISRSSSLGARTVPAQVAMDFMREPLVSINGEAFHIATGGEEEYGRFRAALAAQVKALVVR